MEYSIIFFAQRITAAFQFVQCDFCTFFLFQSYMNFLFQNHWIPVSFMVHLLFTCWLVHFKMTPCHDADVIVTKRKKNCDSSFWFKHFNKAPWPNVVTEKKTKKKTFRHFFDHLFFDERRWAVKKKHALDMYLIECHSFY